MSLKAFHVFFIAISILLAGGIAAWAGATYRHSGSPAELAMSAGSGLAAVGLAFYLRSFLRKWKRVSYL